MICAARLIQEFQTLNDLAAASAEQITRVCQRPDIAAFLGDMRTAMLAILTEQIAQRPVIASSREVVDYLRFAIGFSCHEQMHVLFLDARNSLIRTAHIASGGAAGVALEPQLVVRRALDIGATGLILAHNHPSGCPEPSGQDVKMTRRMVSCASLFDIRLHDHIIVGRSRFASMRQLGLI